MSYYSSVILSDYPTPNTGYYRMDDPFGTVAKDQTVNGYNGTISNTNGTLNGVTLGQSGLLSLDADTAMLLDGTNGLVALPSALNPAGWSALTVEVWINLSNTSFAGTAFVVGNDAPSATHLGFLLGITTSTVFFRIGTGSGFNQVSTNRALSASTVYHLVATFNGTVMTTYLNGVQLGTTTVTASTIASTTNPINIGARPGVSGNNFPGIEDEVVVSNFTLSPAQVAAHYAAGTISTYPYLYGSFQINSHSAGLGYFLQSKDLDLVTYVPTLAPIARNDAWKVNGWQVKERTIQTDIMIIGTSRTDCEARIDTLFQALSLRDQQLVLHEDGRYWTANATTGKVRFQAGSGIVHAKVPVTFLCAHPYARANAAAAPFDSGSLAYTASGSSYISPIFTVAAGGTAYAWPQIHLVNKTASLGSTTLTSALTQGQSYNAIQVSNTSFSGTVGQILTLYALVNGQLWTQKVTVSSAYSTSTVQISVNSFTAAFNFPNTTTVYVSTAWNTVTVSQLTDNYTLSVSSTSGAPLPQTLNDFLDIYCDPSSGMYIVTNGLSQYIDFTGAFPPLEAGNTQFQVQISADSAPTVDFAMAWTPRWLS